MRGALVDRNLGAAIPQGGGGSLSFTNSVSDGVLWAYFTNRSRSHCMVVWRPSSPMAWVRGMSLASRIIRYHPPPRARRAFCDEERNRHPSRASSRGEAVLGGAGGGGVSGSLPGVRARGGGVRGAPVAVRARRSAMGSLRGKKLPGKICTPAWLGSSSSTCKRAGSNEMCTSAP